MSHASPRYLPAIDGLRAVAVMAVIAFHVGLSKIVPGGFTGVDMFFVISGYVVSQSLWQHRTSRLSSFVAGFYRRRVLRILPALLLVVAVSFVVSVMFVPQMWRTELNYQTGLAAYLGMSNLVLAWNTDTYFSPGTELNPFLHTWSLAVEEQFYLLFPVIYYAWIRCRGRSRTVAWLIPALALVSLLFSAVQTSREPLSAFYLLPARFWELAVGAMLFQCVRTVPNLTRSVAMLRFALYGGIAMVMAGFAFADERHFPFPWAMLTVAGTAMTMASIVLPQDRGSTFVHRMLASRAAVFLGRLSYSLYLWHWPVLAFFRWTVGFESMAAYVAYPFIVMALAAASYYGVERPIRSGRLLPTRRAWTTLAASGGLVFIAWSGSAWLSERADAFSLSTTSDTYTWHAYAQAPREPIHSLANAHTRGRRLFALGDSHTAAYRTMLRHASTALGFEVIEYEHGGCAVVSLIAADPADCAESREGALKDIETRARPGDIVFLASLRMPELAGRGWQGSGDAAMNEALAELTPRRMQEARTSAHAVLGRLESLRVGVVVDAPNVLFAASPSRCSDWFNHRNPVCAPGFTVPRERIDQLRAPQMSLLSALQHDRASLVVWDPLPILCPGAVCSAFDPDGQPLFFDADHLSGHGNRVLAPSFTAVLLRMWNETPPG